MLDLLIITLATFYAAHAVTNTSGPFHVFLWLREHIPHGKLLSCFVCAAPWFALLFALLMTTSFVFLTEWFALAGAAVFLWRFTGGGRGD